jgi:hypothetical protein
MTAMGEITISRSAQVGLALGVVAAIAALIVAQLPELERYPRIPSM